MKSFYLFVGLLFLLACNGPEQQDKTPKYTADWESLKQHKTPDWFRDAKFGIYCHWGPYSVPEYKNEWYSHWMYVNENNPEYPYNKHFYEHHVKTYGALDKFGYKDFIPMFKAEKFDAAEWSELFYKAGAKFVGPVSEHADGFAMWDSKLTEWDAKDMGPKRDVMGEMAKEVRKRGMKFIATYHRQWLFGWYPTWDETTDASDPKYAGLYGPKLKRGDFKYPIDPEHAPKDSVYYPVADEQFNREWVDRLKEIIDNYEPDLIWFDNKVDVIGEEYRKEFLQYYYNSALKQNRDVVATYKFHDFAKGTAVLDVERARMSEAKDFPWLTDDSVDWDSWSHTTTPRYKSTNRLIDVFIDIISKNGCLLLNVTPRADGTIPEPVQERLLQIGDWLKVNGEGVYGSRPWTVFGEGPTEVLSGHLQEEKNKDNTAEDIRFTIKDGALYAFVLDIPQKTTAIRALSSQQPNTVKSISLLGSDEEIKWSQNDQELLIEAPKSVPCDYAIAFKILFYE